MERKLYLKKELAVAAVAVGLTACASSTKNIDASYVSPLKYQKYSCDQLSEEYVRLQQKSLSVFKQQDDTASNDALATGVGLILFWPALFLIDSDDQKEEVARLKGELEAVETSAIEKNCSALSAQIVEDREKAEAERKKKAEAAQSE
jgi:hypothetical protein